MWQEILLHRNSLEHSTQPGQKHSFGYCSMQALYLTHGAIIFFPLIVIHLHVTQQLNNIGKSQVFFWTVIDSPNSVSEVNHNQRTLL